MKNLLSMLICAALCLAPICALADGSIKSETVYVLAAADGKAEQVIVSDHLTNPDGAAEIADSSDLSEIENVKGEESFDGVYWQADGNEIDYRGKTDSPLPVRLKISYTLDSQAVSPEEIAGKSGHVRVRFDYSVEGDGEVTAPYLFLTAALLENDAFENVQVVNGRVLSDGERSLVVGFGLPELQKSLDLNEEVNFEIPEYLEFEADTSGFALPVTLTLATAEPFARIDSQRLDDLDELKSAVAEMTSAMTQLIDGASALCNGADTLNSGAGELFSGASSLSDGLDEISVGSAELISSSEAIFDGLLNAAWQQIAEKGVQLPALTRENYADALTELIEQMSEAGVTRQARAQAEAAVRAQEDQIRAAVEQAVTAEAPQLSEEETQALVEQKTEAQIQALIEQSMADEDVQAQIAQTVAQYQPSCAAISALREQLDGCAAFHTGLLAYTQGVASAAEGAEGIETGLSSLSGGAEELCSGLSTLSDGLEGFSAETVEKLDSLVNEELDALVSRVRGLIDAAAEAQNFSGLAPESEGRVRFIWRTAAIEA